MSKDDRARVVELERASARQQAPARVALPPAGGYAEEEPTLGEYLATIAQNRVLIGLVTVTALFLAGAHLVFAAPTFRSDVLLQVEDKTKGIAGLEDLADTFSQKTPADTEIEILRSRSLLGSVVDELNLTIDARPRTFPLVGGAFFRHWDDDDGVAPASLFKSYAWGGERILVTRLEVPDDDLDQPLRLVAGEGRQFTLRGPKGKTLLSGEVGKLASAGQGDDATSIFVAELRARPGTQFKVMKRRRVTVIDDLQTDLRISEKGKKTGILMVSLDGKDPVRVPAILDAIGRTYVRQNVERRSAEAAKTLEFLQQQLPVLKQNAATAEAAYKTYQLKKGSVDLDSETQALLERAVEIEKTLSELEMQRSELRQRFTDSHPALMALNEKQAQLKAQKAQLESKLHGLPDQELESVRLMRDAKVANELYFTLLNKSQELNVMKSGTIGNVRVLDSALRPYEPVSPKKLPVLALALLLGLAGGIGAAFVRKSMDQGVVDPAEVESAAGISVYASVPQSEREAELSRLRDRGGAGPLVLADVDPADLAIESLRSLRTALQFALVDARNNVVTVSGPSPGVGKTFLSVNLAHVLASTGKRVLLVDADLRRGRLHRYLGGQRPNGVSEVISGQLALADAVRKTPLETLEFISTGRIPPNPSEMVGSPRFQAFLDDASKRYDLVLVDTPPILAVTDAALIARHAGVNLVALRFGKHPIREILLALKQFADAGVVVHGAVMNAVVATAGRGSAYAYHYQYAYRSDAKDD